jgi:hypothetical protein
MPTKDIAMADVVIGALQVGFASVLLGGGILLSRTRWRIK